MVQVTNVTVFYGRSRQPAKYESAEAKIEFTASLSDGVGPNADHIAAAQKLLGEAKTIVLTELNLVAVGESASAVVRAATEAAPAQVEAAAPAKPAKPAKVKPVPAPPPGGPGENRVGPEDNDPTAGPSPTAAAPQSAGSADLPDEPKPNGKAQAPVTVALAPAEVQAQVAGLIKEKKIDVATVKKISREFGVERIADIAIAKLVSYKTAIDAAVASFQGVADI